MPCALIFSWRIISALITSSGAGGVHQALDRAAGEAELGGPDGVGAAPADHLADGGGEDVLAEPVVELLYSQSKPPLRQMWARATARMPMKMNISMTPYHLSW